MKLQTTLLAGALLLTHLSYGQITDPAPYCAAGYDDGGGDFPHEIANVFIGLLSNASGDVQYPAPHYVYYNNIAAPDLAIGSSYPLYVAHDGPPATSVHFVAAYIDYNHNNSFDDPGERVLQQVARTGITNPSTASVTIPVTATPGLTRMRVMVFEDDLYSSTATDATPCTADATGYLDWGETEDYDVNLIPATGISEISNNRNLLYPNPANDYIYADQCLTGAEFLLFDLEGKLIQQNLITNQKINLSAMTAGQYIIKVISNNSVYTQRVSIVKP